MYKLPTYFLLLLSKLPYKTRTLISCRKPSCSMKVLSCFNFSTPNVCFALVCKSKTRNARKCQESSALINSYYCTDKAPFSYPLKWFDRSGQSLHKTQCPKLARGTKYSLDYPFPRDHFKVQIRADFPGANPPKVI